MRRGITNQFRHIIRAVVTLQISCSVCFGALKLNPGDRKPFLVIMVDTRQSKFQETTEEVSSWIFPSTTKHYTMQDWIHVNYTGKVSIEPCRETCDTKDDGVVKVALDSDDPPAGEQYATEKSCYAALLKAARFIDFSRYDITKRGKIGSQELGIAFLFARPKIAGCATSFRFAKIPLPKLNGVEMDRFECIFAPPSRDNIGAIAHDWLHLYGEKDFYAHDGTAFGVGALHLGYIWKGLTKGRKGPSNLMPLSIENFGIVPPEVISRPGEYTLRSHGAGQYNYLKIPTTDPQEYFLLENRQFDGFDECLGLDIAKPGIVIYHLDRKMETKGNFNNEGQEHRLVTIVAANESRYGFNEFNVTRDRKRTADHDVLWHQNMVFGPATVPNSKLYSGQDSGISVRVVSPNGNFMKVQVDWGKPTSRGSSRPVAADTPQVAGVDAAALQGAALKAFRAIQAKNYSAAVILLNAEVRRDEQAAAPSGSAKKLLEHIESLAEADWEQIHALWLQKDIFLVRSRLVAHEKSFGKLPGRAEKLAALKAACSTPENVSLQKNGGALCAILDNRALSTPNKVAALKRFVAADAASPYAAIARERIREMEAGATESGPAAGKQSKEQ